MSITQQADKIRLYTSADKNHIEYEELALASGEQYSREAEVRTRVLAVAWADRVFFVMDMIGWSSSIGGSMSRVIPELHPERTDLFCTDLALINPEGQTSQNSTLEGMAKAETAVYRATYRRVPWRVKKDDEVTKERDRYVERVYKFAFEMQKIPNMSQMWQFEDGSGSVDEVGAVPIAFRNLVVTIRDVPPDLVPDFLAYDNKVHTTTGGNGNFDDHIGPGEVENDGYSIDEGVIFSGVETHEHYTNNGDWVTDIIMSFGIRENSWNKYLNQNGEWKTVHKKGSPTTKVFQTANLNDLFEFIA